MLTVATPGEESVDKIWVINFSTHFFLAVRISETWVRAEVAETARVSSVAFTLDFIDMRNVVRFW